jgi:hypothetical protein
LVALAFWGLYGLTTLRDTDGPPDRSVRTNSDPADVWAPESPAVAPAAPTAPADVGPEVRARATRHVTPATQLVGRAAPVAQPAHTDAMTDWARKHGAELRALVAAAQGLRSATGGSEAQFRRACVELGETARARHAPMPDPDMQALYAELRSTLARVSDECRAAVEEHSSTAFEEGTRRFEHAKDVWLELRPRLPQL